MGCAESAPDDIPVKPQGIKPSSSKRDVEVKINITSGVFDEAHLRILLLFRFV